MIATWPRVLLGILAALVWALPGAAAASESWQADPTFAIDRDQVPGSAAGATTARYLLRGPGGEQIGPVARWTANALLPSFQVPPIPGVYELEAWLENADGVELRRTATTLRFDNAAPALPAPPGPGRWLLGEEVAVLKIDHPQAPLPLSGINGYAVSHDRGDGNAPCASATHCTLAETDLAGGIADDSISFGTLPEGATYVRVAAVSGTGVPSPPRTAIFRVDATPPELSLLGLPGRWSDRPVELTATAADLLSGMAAAGPSGPFTAIAVDGGAPATVAGDTARAWVGGSGVHTIAFYARDAAGNVTDGRLGTGAPRTALVRIDEEPPQVAFAAAQDPTEPERIEAVVDDSLSGPSSGRGSIAVRLAGTRARYEPLPTQMAGARLIAHWDSDSYPHGKYEFLATGFDVAGNAGTGTDRARGGRMVLVNPLKTQVSLSGQLSGDRFHGRLRSVGGGPVATQAVAVVESFALGAAPRRRTVVLHTNPRGVFSLRLRPGPSREVTAAFAGTTNLTRAASGSARLDAPTKLRLRASSATATVGGRPILFSGAVGTLGAKQAARGLPVELQFRYPGVGWRGFRTVEADRRGHFRYAYRFSDDDSRGVRFQFRAHVKGREGWPYGPGSSRPLTVTGR